MKVVIIEDEFFSAEKLTFQLQKIDPSIEVVAILPSVESCLLWFKSNPEPDLIFSDIQLEDQKSFAFFEQQKIEAPIIYTTAYDQYAIKAFKQNSIDYLLKPIQIEELRNALKKYEHQEDRILKKTLKIIPEVVKKENKERFLVKKGAHYTIVKTVDIAYFKSDNKLTFLFTFLEEKFVIDQTLDQLTEVLDKSKFNRISRNRIVSLDCILKIHTHFNGRLKLDIIPVDEEVFVSRERVPDFKEWVNS